jgi:hypothetical protein
VRIYETGGLRRTHVRGHGNVLKRLLLHASAFNLGLWMRTLFGIGTPCSSGPLGGVRDRLRRVVEPHTRRDRPALASERPSDASKTLDE